MIVVNWRTLLTCVFERNCEPRNATRWNDFKRCRVKVRPHVKRLETFSTHDGIAVRRGCSFRLFGKPTVIANLNPNLPVISLRGTDIFRRKCDSYCAV
jgi:hypothetical protein